MWKLCGNFQIDDGDVLDVGDGDAVVVGGHVARQLVDGEAGGVDDAARCTHDRNSCHRCASYVVEVIKFNEEIPSTSGLRNIESKTKRVTTR